MLPTSCPNCQVMLTAREAAGRACPSCGAVLGKEGADNPQMPPLVAASGRPVPGSKPARSGKSGILPLVFSILALLFSAAALAHAFFNDPFGIALWGYDFSTPEKALVSQQKIEHNGDIRAMIAYQKKIQSPRAGEMVKTLKVEEVVPVNKAQLVFFTYTYKNKTYYDMMGFIQDPESKLWRPRYIGEYSPGVSEELRKKMEDWRKKGPSRPDDE